MSFQPDPSVRRAVADEMPVEPDVQPVVQQPYVQQPYVQQPYLQQPYLQQPYLQPASAETVAQPVVVPARQQRLVHAPAPVVAAAPVVDEVVVAEPAVVHRRVATSSGQRLALDSVVVGVVGVVLMIIGLIAVTRAGVDGPMDQPVVKVLGFTHTATLGALEVAIAVCLLICAATTSRAGAIFFGLVLGVGAFVGAVQTDSFRRSLALQSGFAWLLVAAALIVVLVSLLLPRLSTHTTRVESL